MVDPDRFVAWRFRDVPGWFVNQPNSTAKKDDFRCLNFNDKNIFLEKY